jgi:hypothetical protein
MRGSRSLIVKGVAFLGRDITAVVLLAAPHIMIVVHDGGACRKQLAS